jgi:nitrate reductase NapAB chaperone NapD
MGCLYSPVKMPVHLDEYDQLTTLSGVLTISTVFHS